LARYNVPEPMSIMEGRVAGVPPDPLSALATAVVMDKIVSH
jgi:hypothetical protein